MDLAQMTADEAEDLMVRRYREHRSTVGQGVTVSCGSCGASQLVRPRRGMRVFALICYACHTKTKVALRTAL